MFFSSISKQINLILMKFVTIFSVIFFFNPESSISCSRLIFEFSLIILRSSISSLFRDSRISFLSFSCRQISRSILFATIFLSFTRMYTLYILLWSGALCLKWLLLGMIISRTFLPFIIHWL